MNLQALFEWSVVAGLPVIVISYPRRVSACAISCALLLTARNFLRKVFVRTLQGIVCFTPSLPRIYKKNGVSVECRVSNGMSCLENSACIRHAAMEKMASKFSEFISANSGDGCGILLIDGPSSRIELEIGTTSSFALTRAGPCTRFEIASVTKMMVSYAVMKLESMSRIRLDAPAGKYVQVKGLRDNITVRQLLTHTSGLPDFWSDGPEHKLVDLLCEIEPPNQCTYPLSSFLYGLGVFYFGSDFRLNKFAFYSIVAPILWRRKFQHIWSPRETLLITLRDYDVASPGTYHYADTNFILLGLLLEELHGKSLHEVLAQEIFRPLQMSDTYVRFSPDVQVDHGFTDHQLSSRYRSKGKWNFGSFAWTFSDMTMAPLPCLTIPPYYISADWASGGVVSTARDLCTFMRAFVSDRHNWKSIVASVSDDASSYGFGVKSVGREEYVRLGHTGNGGACLYYWPHEDVVFAGTSNNNVTNLGTFVNDLVSSGLALSCLDKE